MSLDIRFIKFYRNASRSDNDVIKYLANRAILSYESPMGKNIRFIMSKYVINIHDMISLPMNTLRCTCINISNNYHSSTYAHYAQIVREMLSHDVILLLNRNECQDSITYLCTE